MMKIHEACNATGTIRYDYFQNGKRIKVNKKCTCENGMVGGER